MHAEEVSEKEAATSLAEPGSSRQEKCKRENVDRGIKRLHKNWMQKVIFHVSVLSVFQIVKFKNGDCPASDGNRGVCFTGQ